MSNLNWDTVLTEDDLIIEKTEYITLPEGDYEFTVDDFTYDEYAGSEKIPACPSAKLRATVQTEKGTAYATYNFYLYEGKGVQRVARFLKSVGLDGAGQTFGKLFRKAVNEHLKGYAHIKPSEYNGKTYNNIVYFRNGSEMGNDTAPKSNGWSL